MRWCARDGASPAPPSDDALVRFVRKLAQSGTVSDEDFAAIKAAGYSDAQLVKIRPAFAGRCRRINERRFVRRCAEIDRRRVDYLLHDQPVRFLKGRPRLRQVTRLCDNGHQTQIITSRLDLRDIEVADRMFERWRQVNFF